jgi:hypothetical protein
MVELSGIHSITVAMHEGMLTLAVIAVIIRTLCVIVPKIPIIELFFSEKFLAKVSHYTEATATLAAVGGTVGIVLSAITGSSMFSPRYSTMFTTPIILNKIMWMIFALEFWIVFLALKIRFGEDLWNNRYIGGLYVASSVIGFMFVMLAGSLGGELAGKGTILEPFYQMIGFNPNEPFLLPPIVFLTQSIIESPLQAALSPLSILILVVVINVAIIALLLVYTAASSSSESSH